MGSFKPSPVSVCYMYEFLYTYIIYVYMYVCMCIWRAHHEKKHCLVQQENITPQYQ